MIGQKAASQQKNSN